MTRPSTGATHFSPNCKELGFTLTTDANWNSSGWFIDDVAVR